MATNYRDTLNLPETELSMKAGLPRKEPEILSFWNDIDLYNKIRKLNDGNERFILPWVLTLLRPQSKKDVTASAHRRNHQKMAHIT